VRLPADNSTFEILLVEDNVDDIDLTEEILEETKVSIHVNVARNGVEALAFLRREGAFAGAPRPDLILLDLNLPRKDGRGVLAEMKADTSLLSIPLIVLTTSDAPEDISMSYGHHANCYIVKPFGLDEWARVLGVLVKFWLSVVTLPGR